MVHGNEADIYILIHLMQFDGLISISIGDIVKGSFIYYYRGTSIQSLHLAPPRSTSSPQRCRICLHLHLACEESPSVYQVSKVHHQLCFIEDLHLCLLALLLCRPLCYLFTSTGGLSLIPVLSNSAPTGTTSTPHWGILRLSLS
jgi:hypothetical protein